MQDILGMIASLSRPPLLVRAARLGVEDYDRAQVLPRLLGGQIPSRCGAAAVELLALEQDLDNRRLAQRGDYPVARHVEVLIALMGEARFLRTLAERAAA